MSALPTAAAKMARLPVSMPPKSAPLYVLDSFAMLAYFEAEVGGAAVRVLLEAARDRQAALSMSMINVGELHPAS
jgi:hypothetical protein